MNFSLEIRGKDKEVVFKRISERRAVIFENVKSLDIPQSDVEQNSVDIRKEIDVVARYGGEEFVVALIDTTPEGMIETAERIRKAVGKLEFNVHQVDPLRVTVSIGAFLVEPGFTDMKKAINNADQALYKAKDGGRNQVVRFETVETEAVGA